MQSHGTGQGEEEEDDTAHEEWPSVILLSLRTPDPHVPGGVDPVVPPPSAFTDSHNLLTMFSQPSDNVPVRVQGGCILSCMYSLPIEGRSSCTLLPFILRIFQVVFSRLIFGVIFFVLHCCLYGYVDTVCLL